MIRTRLPRGPVTGLAFLPGGELLAVTPGGLFRSQGGEWEEVGDVWSRRNRPCGAVVADPPGELAAWTFEGDIQGQGGFQVSDLRTGESVTGLRHAWLRTSYPIEISFTPGGGEFHARSGETLRWSVPGWRMLESIPGDWGHRARSPAGHVFAERSVYNRWALLDSGGRFVTGGKRGYWPVPAVTFSPDSRRLYLAERNRVRRFDTGTGAELESRDWGLGGVTALAVSGDGLTAAMGTRTGDVVVWDEC